MENGKAVGIRLEDDSELRSSVVLSNATPKVTFLELLKEASVSINHITCQDLINVASIRKTSHLIL